MVKELELLRGLWCQAVRPVAGALLLRCVKEDIDRAMRFPPAGSCIFPRENTLRVFLIKMYADGKPVTRPDQTGNGVFLHGVGERTVCERVMRDRPLAGWGLDGSGGARSGEGRAEFSSRAAGRRLRGGTGAPIADGGPFRAVRSAHPRRAFVRERCSRCVTSVSLRRYDTCSGWSCGGWRIGYSSMVIPIALARL
jgi:hypothetical protein